MKIIITEFMDEAAVATLRSGFDITYDPKLVDQGDALKAALADADALIVRNRTQVRGDLLAAGAKLRVVGRLGVGLDNIDVPACEARGIEVIPATGANALAVAEYVIGTAMVLLRGAYRATPDVAAGKWPRNALSNGREIAGKTLGLIGFGGIGQLTAKLAKGLGMQVIASDAFVPPASDAWRLADAPPMRLDEVLWKADVVSLHVPLTAETRNLIDATRLAMMKSDAILINTARGGVVDQVALREALAAGEIAGAGLDVTEPEPLPQDDPLLSAPNLLVVPHVGSATTRTRSRMADMAVENLLAALAGKAMPHPAS